ncbi:BTB/POZ domain-containing protein At5g17580-like [Camellia sinensis]|nr:BTB/POZ domain-containing protein At5g17580-like [Camellia sinensis]
MAARSEKLVMLLKENPNEDISYLLRDIPADPETLELVMRFCHGLEVNMSTENVVPLSCLAYYLGMTEKHSTNNLLKKTLTYFEQRIISSWNESIKGLRASGNILEQAVNLGLVEACIESIVAKALVEPRLLGEPIKNSINDDDSESQENGYRPNARRQLFVLDWQSQDLISLSLQLYEPIIQTMIQRHVPQEYVSASLSQYAKKWLALIVEKGLRLGLENELDQATVKDLLIPSQGYAREAKCDVECVRRILKNFYCNYTHSDISGLITVAQLVEDLLAEVANDVDLKTITFISLAEMSNSVSVGIQRSSDGIYRAIDIYLDKHRHLTESEREEVCRVLNCHKMSQEACEHPAQNERLPLRVVVQILFAGHLHLRDTITKKVQGSDERLTKLKTEDEEEAERVSSSEEGVKIEMEKMGSKVMELERECCIIRKEIQCSRGKKEKFSVWREMKRKFGCTSSMNDFNSHLKKKKKVHPRQ